MAKRIDDINRKWGSLQYDLCRALSISIPAYDWQEEFRFSKTRRQALDIAGVPRVQGYKVGIELERARATCARNIIKLWMHLDKWPEDFLLIQVFSPVFINDKKTWLEEAEFIGRKAFKDTGGKLFYKPIILSDWPAEDPTVLKTLTESIKGMIP